MDKIQMTEEQARKMHYDVVSDNSTTGCEAFINGLKDQGYIIKSPVDKAEEIRNEIYSILHEGDISRKLLLEAESEYYKAIQYLKKQIEELKNED